MSSLLHNPSLSNRQPPACHALATCGPAQLCKLHCNQRGKAARKRHHSAPADYCVTCFQAIDFYIANKVFLFDLLNALLQNAEEVQWQHVCGNCFHADFWCTLAHYSGYRGFFSFIFFFLFFGRGWFPRVSIINMFNPLMASLAVFPADTSLRLEGVTSLSSQRCIFQPSCKHSLLHCKSSTCARMNFSPGILSSTTD